MLVLSRKINETILIGSDVEISVLSIDGDRVRLGITAPKSMRIFRQELIREVRDVNREAIITGSTPIDLDKALKEAKK